MIIYGSHSTVQQYLFDIDVISEESLIPRRIEAIGTATSEDDLEQIKKLESDKWEEIVPITALQPGYQETRHNYQKVPT